MNSQQSISLSFFELSPQDFDFTVFRRPFTPGDRREDNLGLSKYSLPPYALPKSANEKYTPYWLQFDPDQELEEFLCVPEINPYLTCEYLYNLLLKQCESKLRPGTEFCLSKNRFRHRTIEFVLHSRPEGRQIVWMEPFLLKAQQKFGFLIDFSFRASEEYRRSVEARKLSLSLDKGGRTNRNYYSDKYDKITNFVSRFSKKLFFLENNLTITPTLTSIGVHSLEKKTYLFSDGKASASQFVGIRRIGPLRRAHNIKKVYFVFQETHRAFSYDLYRALRGDTYPQRFPGMEEMFGYAFDRSNVGGMPLSRFDLEDVTSAVSAIRQDAGQRQPILIFLSPFDKFSKGRDDRVTYISVKHLCLSLDIPCQFVSIPLLQRKKQFEWAISGIGLQLFAKMGGWPWKVQHQTPKCLIVGISQAHERKNGKIKKYFAYSTFTDSSGIYRELKILGETENEDTYIALLRRTLASAITKYYGEFDSFVIHTTFSLRKNEMEAIKDVIAGLDADEVTNKSFTVMKFNDDNKFFGYASANNSLIPYESSYIQLSFNEYLIWFEGLQYRTHRVPANIERPVHVEFIYPKRSPGHDSHIGYLQDALNISGANWRGFNAKSLPVSIFYAILVARYYRDFKRHGLDDIDFETVTPWFL